MKRRAFLATGILAGSLLTGVAFAAPAPTVCQIIKDAKGDAKYAGAVPGDSSVDIVSADVASDGKIVTGVVRVDKLTVPNPQAPLGQAWFVKFNVKGAPEVIFLSARQYPQGNVFVFGYTAPDPTLAGINTSYTLGTATGVLDMDKNEIRISAPAAEFKKANATIVKGAKLSGLLADTWRIAGQGFVPSQQVGPVRAPLGGLLLPFDNATGTTYTVGTKSCVALGK